MQVSTSTRQPSLRIGHTLPSHSNDSHQFYQRGALTAPDAGALGTGRAACRGVYPSRHGGQPEVGSAATSGPEASCPGDSGAGAVSDLMSIRHPVSRAARRAFWPSRPIASDN